MTAIDQARAAERVPAPAIAGLIEDAIAAVGVPRPTPPRSPS